MSPRSVPHRHDQMVPHGDAIMFPEIHEAAYEHLVPLGNDMRLPRRRRRQEQELNEPNNMADPQNAGQDGNRQALPAEEAPFQDLEPDHVVPEADNPDDVIRGEDRRVIRPPNHQLFFFMPRTTNSNPEEEQEALVRFRIQGQVLESMSLPFPLLYCLSDHK